MHGNSEEGAVPLARNPKTSHLSHRQQKKRIREQKIKENSPLYQLANMKTPKVFDFLSFIVGLSLLAMFLLTVGYHFSKDYEHTYTTQKTLTDVPFNEVATVVGDMEHMRRVLSEAIWATKWTHSTSKKMIVDSEIPTMGTIRSRMYFHNLSLPGESDEFKYTYEFINEAFVSNFTYTVSNWKKSDQIEVVCRSQYIGENSFVKAGIRFISFLLRGIADRTIDNIGVVAGFRVQHPEHFKEGWGKEDN